MTEQCKAVYERQVPWADADIKTPIQCTYIEGHDNSPVASHHSWNTLKVQDECDREAAAATAAVDYTPVAVQALLDGLFNGDLDPYIEAILAAGHSRKRARRGVLGFPTTVQVHQEEGQQ